MSHLSTEDLAELTKLVNERLAEFGNGSKSALTPGLVRLVAGVIDEWHGEAKVTKSVFVGIRMEEDQVTKLKEIADAIGENGNMSAAIRHIIDAVPTDDDIVPAVIEIALPLRQPAVHSNGALGCDMLRISDSQSIDGDHSQNEPPKGRRGNVLPTLQDLIAEVQRQAMGGVMPTKSAFDVAKPANWANSQSHVMRLGITWNGLAEEAGLKPNPRVGGKA